MKILTVSTRTWAWVGAFAVLCTILSPRAHAIPALPDPCALITVPELVQIIGPVTGKPKPGDIKGGDISCEWTPAKGAAWVSLRLNEGDLAFWKRRNGGKSPVSVPELGPGAFMNLEDGGSTDLYVGKGQLVLVVSMPVGPKTVEHVKAIAARALPRL